MSSTKNNYNFNAKFSDTENKNATTINISTSNSLLPSASTWGKKKVQNNTPEESLVLQSEESLVLDPVENEKFDDFLRETIDRTKYTPTAEFSKLEPSKLLEISSEWVKYRDQLYGKLSLSKDPKKIIKLELELDELKQCIDALEQFNLKKHTCTEFEYLSDVMRELKENPNDSRCLYNIVLKKLKQTIPNDKKPKSTTVKTAKKHKTVKSTPLKPQTKSVTNNKQSVVIEKDTVKQSHITTLDQPQMDQSQGNVFFFSDSNDSSTSVNNFVTMSKPQYKPPSKKQYQPLKMDSITTTTLSSTIVPFNDHIMSFTLDPNAVEFKVNVDIGQKIFLKEDFLTKVNEARAAAISRATTHVFDVLEKHYTHNTAWNTRECPAGPNNKVKWFPINLTPEEDIYFTTPTSKQITLSHYFSNMDSFFLGKVKKNIYGLLEDSKLLENKQLILIPVRSKNPLEYKLIISVDIKRRME